ncbi:DNA-binding MarR family transcriptional regulator [Planifilum fimeticola]|jgi:DNA-binding MarR family transcriptional regulator|uniref:DNA-binding MarR family transcriptional regulator n=1 Tax=Planifilum fimeticola TaxID=201975 RepID=A0A2T0LFE4_9BACL|nr:MarR family transcriptional regulator [Planifilum fimeticola]PRX40749.1 DNA-binding MarR family transcriptional regulator [Planifilum fimeticola]
MDSRLAAIQELESTLRAVFQSFRGELNALIGDQMTLAEYHLLRILHRDGSRRISDLAQDLGVSMSHVTNVTDRLETKGWVVRRRSEQDRRAVELHITDSARKRMEELQRKKEQYYRNKLSSLPTESIHTLIDLLKQLI